MHPNAVSCRSTNRARDGEGIDITNCDEAVHGRMVDNIQCKTAVRSLNYAALLKRIKKEGIFSVIFHRSTKKSKEGRFMKQDEYALCFMDDYIKLLAYREAFKLLINDVSVDVTDERLAIYHKLKELEVI